MTDEKTPPASVALRPTYRVVDQAPPQVCHVVNFHRVGTDVLMTVGRIDIAEVATRLEALRGKGETLSDSEMDFEVEVFARFAMSPDAFARMVANAQQIFEAMEKTGHLTAEHGDNRETSDEG